MATALISHPIFDRHEAPTEHPECPQRLGRIGDVLDAHGVFDQLQLIEAPAATRRELERVHSPDYLDALDARQLGDSTEWLDADTYMTADTLPAARHAAGAAVLATRLVLEGTVTNAFCGVRPPGHHASSDAAMGFCFLNNVAVGAAEALATKGIDRVAILDFDVHHGNGTENIFREDERVLLCQTYQHPYYPFTGEHSDAGHIINAPLTAASGTSEFREAVNTHWVPAIESFSPQMIFISAGFDARAGDPLGGLALVDEDFQWVTARIVELAAAHAKGRIVSCLEGGYDLDTLGASTAAHVRTLASL